ncbi:MAG: hypothetical protein HRT40_02260 [Campylobacteraceae bacterium]|nr:hypothetical protein [Campylobacteraceae bacterium]
MVKQSFKVLKVISLFLLLLLTNSSASENFLLNSDAVIDPRTTVKINQIGNELKDKTGINVYLYAKKTFGVKKNTPTKEKLEYIKNYEENLLKQLKKPYVILTLALDETHVNIRATKDLKNVIDKNEILNEYVIPLLASKDKNDLFAKTSAAVLNGYDEIVSQIVESKGLERLDSAIGESGKTFSTIWKVIMYSLVVFGILSYTVIILRSKKK